MLRVTSSASPAGEAWATAFASSKRLLLPLSSGVTGLHPIV